MTAVRIDDACRRAMSYAADRAAVMDAFDGNPGQDAARALSDATDGFVRGVIGEVIDVSEHALQGFAVAGVGGYGRREMFPGSDVDVAFIAADGGTELEAVVRRAFTAMSDALNRAGVRFGHSYLQPDDMEGLPLGNVTALLDGRLVAGNADLFRRFESALERAVCPATFVLHHLNERQHPKGLDTPFVAEPDIKTGAGGLRDLHTALWMARVAFGPVRGSPLDALRKSNCLTDSELLELENAGAFVSSLRWKLHCRGGRESLTRDRQDVCAAELGFRDTGEMMARYYAHAATVRKAYRAVAGACEATSLELEPGVSVARSRISIAAAGSIAREPALVLRVFRHAKHYGLKISGRTQDMIRTCFPGACSDPVTHRLLLETLVPPGTEHVLAMMARCDLLQAIIPEFEGLMRQVPPDPVHRFTVGEHTLRVVCELERQLTRDKALADVMARVQEPECLFIAALLHDIGKSDGEGDHAARGARAARQTAERLRMSHRQCETVESLVREHTLMSDLARLRDVTDDRTALELAEAMPDPDLLDMLLLLTFADYNAVGALRLSEFHRGCLLDLHSRTRSIVLQGLTRPDMDRHRRRLKRRLVPAKLPAEEIEAHCASLPDRYLLNTAPKDIALHITLARAATAAGAAVDMHDEKNQEHTRLIAAASDRPGLLSDIAGTLYALDLNVHSAQVFTRADGICLDILNLDCDGRSLCEGKKDEVDAELTSVLQGINTPDVLLRRIGRPAGGIPAGTSAEIISGHPDAEAVIEVRAPDSPGLLYALTRQFQEHGLSIHSARVATWGHRIRDVFYLTDQQGQPPAAATLESLVRALEQPGRA